MSILDDAIREHLELKRAHGADESEIKKLEDEAFGPPGRPEEPADPLAEAPTEFMATEAADAGPEAEEPGGRRINIADLQEPPEPKGPEPDAAPEVEVQAVEPAESPAADAGPLAPAEDAAQAAPPAEEPPATEHEIVSDSHNTEERHAIAEQPTEFFDVEAEMGTEDSPATEAVSPSDEEIAAAEQSEPKLAPVDPPTEIHAVRAAPEEPVEEEEDDDFWSEQRLSDELDQALEAPITDEHEAPPPPPAPEATPLFDHEGGEDDARPERDDDQPRPDYDPDTGHEDVLEDTPDFLEESPEDDELWFEQRPPKDFDFDD
ncbi:MAG TPA: hypothetical protein VGV34_08270 [Solirubrobacterales bacterium]|nr:hypothetical protein [Solirubrobacterales bacterium]